jgi:hypothetical protein
LLLYFVLSTTSTHALLESLQEVLSVRGNDVAALDKFTALAGAAMNMSVHPVRNLGTA